MKVIMPNKQKVPPENKGNSLMKMLLTNRLSNNSKIPEEMESTSARSLPYSSFRKAAKGSEQEDFKMCEYINNVSGLSWLEDDKVQRDHGYARSTKWHAVNYLAKPCRYLYTQAFHKSATDDNDAVDVDTVVQEPVLPLTPLVSQPVASKSDSEVGEGSGEESNNWEDKVSRVGWSAAQIRILPKAVRLLDDAELPRLTYKGRPNEELQIDAAMSSLASRLSTLLASISWDKYTTQWLHGLLMEKATPQQKKDYLELLGFLKKKCPALVERMITPIQVGRSAVPKDVDHLAAVIGVKTNRVAEMLSKESFGKLPHGPVFLVIPPVMDVDKSDRLTVFLDNLRQMAQVYVVNFKPAATNTTVNQCLDQMMVDTRAKLTEIRTEFSGRPIILVGWTLGSSIACLVAQLEAVNAVVCLGFQMKSIDGCRGEPDDPILDMTCPLLFIIGQKSILVRQEELEEMRTQMKVATQLVIFGCCNDRLLMSRKHMINFGVTQTMIDRSITLEIYNFVGELLTQPPLPPPRAIVHPVANSTEGKRTSGANKRKFVVAEVKDSPEAPTKRSKTTKQTSKYLASADGKVIVVPPATPSKRKPRMTPTQKLLLNSAKYAAELPPDYAAQLQQASANAQSESTTWSRGKLSPSTSPQPPNVHTAAKVGRTPKTPDSSPTRRVICTPTLVGEQGIKTPLSGPRGINLPGLVSPQRTIECTTKVVHINKGRSLNLIQPGSTLLLTSTSPKTTKAVNPTGGGTTLIASHVKPLGNLKSIMSLPPRMSYLTATTKPADGSKLTVIRASMDFGWISNSGDVGVLPVNSDVSKALLMPPPDDLVPILSPVTTYPIKNTKKSNERVISNVKPSNQTHINKPMSLNDESLTPDAILQLPIIFAKDGENILDLPIQNSTSPGGSFTMPLEVPSDGSVATRLSEDDGELTSTSSVIVISSDCSSRIQEPGIKAPKKYTRRSNSTNSAKHTKMVLANGPKQPQPEGPITVDAGIADINLPLTNETVDQTIQCIEQHLPIDLID